MTEMDETNMEEEAEDLKALQPQLIYNLINEKLTDEELEKLFVCCVKLGADGFSLDDAVSSLNHALKLLTSKTDQFPSIEMLRGVQELIERLTSNPKGALYLSSNTTWTSDMTLLIRRLLQTFKISDEYMELCFEMSAAMLTLFGTKWFRSKDIFPVLLSSLASGRLRIVVEEPEKIEASRLVPLLSIIEFFMDAIEDSDFFNDENATKMSYHIKEACTFLFDYISECDKANKVIPEEIMNMLHGFLCKFISMGGIEMLSKDTVLPPIFTEYVQSLNSPPDHNNDVQE